jgi:glycine/D-amino acid oxidase-like deaminating enzyme
MCKRSSTSGVESYRLVKEIPVADAHHDVVVAGGGLAGTSAAVCAARLGATVLLVEATGCLGGTATSGMVNTLGPMADGERQLACGFVGDLVETLYRKGFMPSHVSPDWWRKAYLTWVPFQMEGLKLVLDELTSQAGAEVSFFTHVTDVDAERSSGLVKGIIVRNTEGCHYLRARTFVDCTGDAALADLAGARCCVAGRDTPHAMPGSMMSLLAGIGFANFAKDDVQELLEQAIKDGHFTQPDRHFPGMVQVGDTVGYLNGGHLYGITPLDSKSMSEGARQGRRLAQEYLAFCRKYLPGHANAELVATAPSLGIRESRRIVGEFELTADDFLARRQFSDQIAVYNRPLDVHAYDASPEQHERLIQDFVKVGRLNPPLMDERMRRQWAATEAGATCRPMCSNWALRSGCDAPSRVLRLACRL